MSRYQCDFNNRETACHCKLREYSADRYCMHPWLVSGVSLLLINVTHASSERCGGVARGQAAGGPLKWCMIDVVAAAPDVDGRAIQGMRSVPSVCES